MDNEDDFENNSGSVYSNDVYYRIYYIPEKKHYTVVCMQDFDECDYHEHQFVFEKGTDKRYYWMEESQAIQRLNEWFDQDKIDPAYRRMNGDDGIGPTYR